MLAEQAVDRRLPSNGMTAMADDLAIAGERVQEGHLEDRDLVFKRLQYNLGDSPGPIITLAGDEPPPLRVTTRGNREFDEDDTDAVEGRAAVEPDRENHLVLPQATGRSRGTRTETPEVR